MNASKRVILLSLWCAASAAPQRLVAALDATSVNCQFNYIGEQREAARVVAERQIPLGGETELREVRYSIRDSRVASVASSGVITAVAPGTTELVVSTARHSAIISISVRLSRRGDLNGDGRVDRDDIRVMQRALNSRPTIPNDARDLNHDGKIDALDLRILTSLCTSARCGVRQ
jgi:hypothetical protein